MVEIESARLLMRQWREEDFEAYAGFYADEETARFVGGVKPRHEAWRHMAMQIGHWVLRGFGVWAVEEKEGGVFVGAAGLWRPEGWPELEVGYWLLPSAWGKGFATEAARRARRYAYEELGATTLVSYIHPKNGTSKKVAERLGARPEEVIELLTYGPVCVYRHPPPAEAD